MIFAYTIYCGDIVLHRTFVHTIKQLHTTVNPLRTVVPYMCHGKMEFDTCEQITITSSSLT